MGLRPTSPNFSKEKGERGKRSSLETYGPILKKPGKGKRRRRRSHHRISGLFTVEKGRKGGGGRWATCAQTGFGETSEQAVVR